MANLKLKMTLNRNKRNSIIIRLYIISLFCIICYFFLENSNNISNLVQISEKGRYVGFPIFFLTGLFKYGLLVIGIGIILILSFLLTREKLKNS